MNNDAEQYVENKSPKGETFVFAQKTLFNEFHSTELKALTEECHEIIHWFQAKTKRHVDVFLEECRDEATGERMVACCGEYEEEDKDYVSVDLVQTQTKYGEKWQKNKAKDNFRFALFVALRLLVLDKKQVVKHDHIVELQAAYYYLQYKFFTLKNRLKARFKS